MASPPSSALDATAVAAVALAGVLADLARTLPLPAETAGAALSTARVVARVRAPRLAGPDEAAALAAALVAGVQAVARDAPPSDAAAGLYAAALASRGCVPTSASPALTRVYAAARAMCVGMEAACLGEAFLCEARTAFGDRRAASTARDRITAALDGALDRVAGTLGQPAAFVMTTAAGQCCARLSDVAGSLQPLIRVDAARSFPSTGLGWSLYADPSRGAELVARNGVGTPMFMPAAFEALAPRRAA